MNKIALFIAFLMLIAPAYAGDKQIFSRPITLQSGFLNGEQFLNLPEYAKAYYSMGIIDGYLSAPMFGGDNKYLNWISNCVKHKTNTQISAILVKYLKENPGRWEEFTQNLMFEALVRACD